MFNPEVADIIEECPKCFIYEGDIGGSISLCKDHRELKLYEDETSEG